MKTITFNQTRQWLKTSQHPLAKLLFRRAKALLQIELPAPKFIFSTLYAVYCLLRTLFTTLTRIFCWTPLFKGRLDNAGKNLYLYGGLPYVSGPIRIQLGDNCRISGNTTLSGRTISDSPPLLVIGSNVDIGWMTTIAVGSNVEIGDNVRIAGRALLAGYPGHPLDAKSRAMGYPDTNEQIGNIVLEKDVWLATGVSVIGGVRIGQGTIVAAGSVVTHDLPPMVLAGGVPARVIRQLETSVNIKKDA